VAGRLIDLEVVLREVADVAAAVLANREIQVDQRDIDLMNLVVTGRRRALRGDDAGGCAGVWEGSARLNCAPSDAASANRTNSNRNQRSVLTLLQMRGRGRMLHFR